MIFLSCAHAHMPIAITVEKREAGGVMWKIQKKKLLTYREIHNTTAAALCQKVSVFFFFKCVLPFVKENSKKIRQQKVK